MKFLCLAYGDQQKMEALTKVEFETLVAKCRVHDEELLQSGHLILVESLDWTTKTVRARSGKVVTSDGPFVETKEQLGGFMLIEARDLNEAIRIASRIPPGRLGCIEVRPVRQISRP